jgi:predicted type IV restriction endonuclease
MTPLTAKQRADQLAIRFIFSAEERDAIAAELEAYAKEYFERGSEQCKLERKRCEEIARREGMMEAADIAEGGCFLHDEAPDAIFGKACGKAIRARAQEGK